MTNYYQTLLIPIVVSALVAGCGGSDGSSDSGSNPGTGSSSTTYTGMFVDSAVEGIFYQTETHNGYTNSAGEFNYQPGETVRFSVGDISLPSVVAGDIITPLDLARTSDIDNPIAINIARLLQTLDSDGDPSNGIHISSDIHQLLADNPVSMQFDDSDFDTAYDSLMAVPGLDRQPVDATSAKAHLSQTISDIAPLEFTQQWIEDRTLYLVMFGEGDINGQEPENVSVVAEMTFHSDMTLSYKGLVNDDNDAVIDYAIEDGKLFTMMAMLIIQKLSVATHPLI